MKKYLLISLITLCFFAACQKVYALSSKFEFVIETVGIPRYNAYGEEINEDVYYTYNVFSYGKPNKITTGQRWKNSKYGLWTKGGGSYKNSGIRGEYYILGTSYSGAVIYNYYFPMDVIPNTTPEKWTFYSYPGAQNSWKDTSKYKYEEQLEYMKNSKLMFNDISSRDRADNPDYIKEYNITANKIGLSKARLDTAATWKTYGMISTRRYINGVIYSQVYLVKPMAADAQVESSIEVANEYILDENEDELVIPIKYSTKVINMTGYADKIHIKEIRSSLYINGKQMDYTSGSKIISVGNEYLLIITRENYPPNKSYNIEICVDGYMHTEFAVDGLMQNKEIKNITVHIEPKKIIPVKESEIKILEKNEQNLVVRPLAQNLSTVNNSLGFTEAGKYLIIKLDLNVLRKDLQDINIYLDNEKLKTFKEYDSQSLVISFKIDEMLDPSLYGEYSLRKQNDSYFEVNKQLIGTRRKEPHIISVKFKYNNKEYLEEFEFDTLDTVLQNVNDKILIKTNYDNNEKILLKDWINEGK